VTAPALPQPAGPTEPEGEEEGGAMTFWEHLEELRKRLIYMIIAFAVGGGVAWTVREQILVWLSEPFIRAWNGTNLGGKPELHFPAPQALFLAYVKLAFIGGLVFSLPIILYQVWAFISPGLYSKEKRYAIPFVVSSCGLFAGGAWFGWKFAFPVAFQYLLSFSGNIGTAMTVHPSVMIDEYIGFVSQMLIGFGSVFELPVLVFFLSVAGMINHLTLIRFFRVFVVIAFVIAAVLTPPDPLSQLLLAIPLCGLYGISIGVAYVFGKKPEPEDGDGGKPTAT
jgi:sec-independent protein translocase protein TatC